MTVLHELMHNVDWTVQLQLSWTGVKQTSLSLNHALKSLDTATCRGRSLYSFDNIRKPQLWMSNVCQRHYRFQIPNLKIKVTWCCRGHFHSGICEAVCCPSWPRGSLLPFHLRKTGKVSKWSPTWRGPGPGSHQDTPYTPDEGRSTVVSETH